ncbi:MAG TPA: STAS domain-containing protein [Aquihabitans sp.]|jgi:anti-anti-sigma factor|nr:STAS domain-containing protein [Aquihabitans sp.]
MSTLDEHPTPSPDLRVEVIDRADGPWVRLHGELDRRNEAALRSALGRVVRPDRGITIDLTDVAFVDAGGLRALHDLQQFQETVHQPVTICQPSTFGRRLLGFVGLTAVAALPSS